MSSRRIDIAGTAVDLMDQAAVLDLLSARWSGVGAPLAVASINLDHVHHFGTAGVWHEALGAGVDWLNLLDGAPIVDRARTVTGERWPRLAGSDLMAPILERAEADGVRIGFLGGSDEAQSALLAALARDLPALQVAGSWSPTRAQITDPIASALLAAEVRAQRVDVLVVGLGKPRQELWIEANAVATGARVLLAFGAVVDFLAGLVPRSPDWMASAGLEWMWRLGHEPRRLARRYLVDGPGALLAVRRSGRPLDAGAPRRSPTETAPTPPGGGTFATDGPAEVTAVVVTYNSADDIEALVASLRVEAAHTALRVIVADNDSSDSTADLVGAHPDIHLIRTGGNLGYSGGINAAMAALPHGEHLLIVNPDLSVGPGAVRALLDRLRRAPDAGVVVPFLADERGERFPSIRREPTVSRALGDAALGSRLSRRPAWASDIDDDPSSYQFAHPVEWASGAALLVRAETAAEVGRWDERYFLYSEETDFLRAVRDAGWRIWFDPAARMRHRQGGSGSSSALTALMAVNRVRYAEKHHGRAYATAFRAVVALHEGVRSRDRGHRLAYRATIRRRTWSRLPRAASSTAVSAFATGTVDPSPTGSIVIPAHDEAALIQATLRSLGSLPRTPGVEVVVVCNGCTDDTARLAREIDGVRVIEIAEASKAAALNAGDAVATAWPRIYLDADILIAPVAVRAVLDALADDASLEAARPAYRYDTTGASALVRAYYRARMRIPSLHRALWGAGIYAVNERGRARFGAFPALTADDLFVDRAFPAGAKRIIATTPVVVRTPRDAASLLRVLRRVARGSAEASGGSTTGTTLRELVRSVRSPARALDAAVYAGFVLRARSRTAAAPAWERDDSSRQDPAP